MERSSSGSWRSEDWIDPGDSWSTRVSARQYRRLIDLINRYVPASGAVLDWGSGSGRTSFALLAAGLTVDAYDFVEPPQLPVLEDKGGGAFTFTLATAPVALPFDTGTFDAVTSVGVLEHVRETGGREEASLAEIRRVLKPGGTFICCHFPNQHSWIDAVARRVPSAHSHPYRYRRQDIVRLLDDAGFSLKELHRYGTLPRNKSSKLPRWFRQTRRGADTFDRIDDGLTRVLAPISQNWAFAATR